MVSVGEENDIDDSEPIPYTAPVVETRTLESEIICAPVITPRPTPQQGARRAPKRNRKENERPAQAVATTPEEQNTPIFAYILAALALVALGILCFASLGAAVFFLPLLAGAFK